MLTLLFWNLKDMPLTSSIVRIAFVHAVDVIMLAETQLDPTETATALNAATGGGFGFAPSDRKKIQVYFRLNLGHLAEQYVDAMGNITIRRLDLQMAPSILLAVVHAPAKGSWGGASQAGNAGELARDILRVEEDVNHDRTVVVGDLNMNPYEAGICGAHGFNAAITKRQASLGVRTVQGRDYPYFYNPMWAQFGDRTPGPPGTYYHRSPPPESHIWNVYDQVLLRPSLMDKLHSVEVLASDGTDLLTTDAGLPSQATCSDHLPLLIRLNI